MTLRPARTTERRNVNIPITQVRCLSFTFPSCNIAFGILYSSMERVSFRIFLMPGRNGGGMPCMLPRRKNASVRRHVDGGGDIFLARGYSNVHFETTSWLDALPILKGIRIETQASFLFPQ